MHELYITQTALFISHCSCASRESATAKSCVGSVRPLEEFRRAPLRQLHNQFLADIRHAFAPAQCKVVGPTVFICLFVLGGMFWGSVLAP